MARFIQGVVCNLTDEAAHLVVNKSVALALKAFSTSR
jgi:hypothetical protein